MSDSIDAKLKLLRSKQQTLFQRVQRVFELTKNIHDIKIKNKFQVSYRLVAKTVTEFDNLDFRINELELEKNSSYTPKFNESLHELVEHIEAAAEKLEKGPSQIATSVAGLTQSASVTAKPSLRLPKIELPSFNGNPSDWPVFYELFRSLIHENSALSDQERVQYLLSRLSNAALNACKHLLPVATNYKIIWELLINRYNDPRALRDSYLDKIFEFRPLKSESKEGLMAVLDKFCAPITAIKQLGGEDLVDSIFLNRGLKILDPISRRAFEAATREKAMPTYKEFVEFLEKQIKTVPFATYSTSGRQNRTMDKPHSFLIQSASKAGVNANICSYCKKSPHKLIDCESFLELSPWDRFRFAKQNAMCLKCFSPHHFSSKCDKKCLCSICSKAHHHLLHFEFPRVRKSPTRNEGNEEANNVKFCSVGINVGKPKIHEGTTVLLSTAQVNMFDFNGQTHSVRFLIDSGSESHFLTRKTCQKLRLPITPVRSSVRGFGGGLNSVSGKVVCKIVSKVDPNTSFVIEPLVVDKIVDKLPSKEIDRSKLTCFEHISLADNKFHCPGEVHGIIGAKLVPHLLNNDNVKVARNDLIAIDSRLGFIVMGEAPTLTDNNNDTTCLVVSQAPVEDLLKSFFDIEEVPSVHNVNMSPADSDCEEIYLSTVRRLDSGRFVVSLPFRENPDCLGNSFDNAKRRLLNLENRFRRDSEFKSAYIDVMQDYLQQGHLSLVPNADTKNGYYIPHHGVFKPRSTSTPLRIVFDASAKTTSLVSLNDILYVGQKLQTDIFGLLINFRLFPVALTADIKQMYRQIFVDQSHTSFQKILWRFSEDEPIQTYELTCVVFGISSSPFLALRTVHKLIEEEEMRFPDAAARLPHDMFMDDLVTSLPSVSEAVGLAHQAKELFASGGFTLTKWMSNMSEFSSRFLDEEKQETTKRFDSDTAFEILGLRWRPEVDKFEYQVKQESRSATKRHILSAIARIFDPLGFLAPIILYAKNLIKILWQQGIDWDELAPPSILQKWEAFENELPILANLRIPRHVGIQENTRVTLVGFCDASEIGYGAVIYVKVESDCREPILRLLCGKSKVAPSKILTIPRLELCAALLLSKLYRAVLPTIRSRCTVESVLAFSDSNVVLCWINAPPSKWQTFVANRVVKIQEGEIDNWFYIKGVENPADCLSRGLTPSELINHPLWWAGPEWLKLDKARWPITCKTEVIENPPETKGSFIVITTPPDNSNRVRELIDRSSNYSRLLRTTVYILRILKLLPTHAQIATCDLEKAEFYLCKVVQGFHFAQDLQTIEKNGNCRPGIQRLSPFIDRGLLRVGGRLRNANVDFNYCHPIILPKKDRFVVLLIDHYHRAHCHAGPHLLLSVIRQNFWIVAARQIIRNRVRKCNACFKVRPSASFPKMGDLPSFRVLKSKPFLHSGVDYAGPINICMARRRKSVRLKAYICLFVCFSTKAVHIELVSELSTPMFLNAFRRFLSRRGPCRVIYSDCGTNFVGAKKELERLSVFFDSEKYQTTLMQDLADYRITWKFIPPGAPHFGGIWESNIKSVKAHLFRVIGAQILTYEELNSILVQIEGLLNSRPLCPLSSDPSEPIALTPAHFLTLTPLKYLPGEDLAMVPLNRLSRFQLLDRLVQSFWERWRKEYLHELQVRKKWSTLSPSLQVGSLVIVDQPNLPPLKWPLGRIEEVFPGEDGVVRVATVRTASGVYKRPVVKLYPLPSQ